MYQSIILNVNKSIDNIQSYYELLNDNGIMWIVARRKDKSLDFLNIIEDFEKKGFILNNIILWCRDKEDNNFMTNRYTYIYKFIKSKDFSLNKDAVREPHIWGHLDWGKRENKYNPKGKDPSNVWNKVIDDGKGNTIGHKALSEFEVFERMILASTNDMDNVLTNFPKEYLNKLNRRFSYTDILYEDDYISIIEKANTPIIENKELTVTDKIYFQSSEFLSSVVEANSINTIITSPPYWDIKNYNNNKKQIGYKSSYDEYMDRLNKIWKECFTVLRDDGNIFINVNNVTKNKEMVTIHSDIIKNMERIGFKFIDSIMWCKPSAIPNPNTFCDKFEFVLWFSKSDNHKVIDRQLPYHFKWDGIHNNSNLFLLHKKQGNIVKTAHKFKHPAIYPRTLVEYLLLLTTNEGDTVLDPFLGSGTTLIECLNQNRNVIGIELSEDYKEIIETRKLHNL